jgi:hypothetical protein
MIENVLLTREHVETIMPLLRDLDRAEVLMSGIADDPAQVAEMAHVGYCVLVDGVPAAIFGAVPLAVAFGTGAELRQPLGIAIIGGLIVSQMLTLFTTPVIYLYFDRLAMRVTGRRPANPLAPREPAE